MGVYYYNASLKDDVIGCYAVKNNLLVTCASTTNLDLVIEYASRDYIVKGNGFRTDSSYLTYSYNMLDQTATVLSYFGSDKDVVIPETVNGYMVTTLADKAFYSYSTSRDLTSITLPATINTIGEYSIGVYYYDGSLTVNKDLQVYYYDDEMGNLGDMLLNYVSKDYIVNGNGMKSPILLTTEEEDTTTEPEEVDPYANYIFDVNQDGSVNSVDLLLLKKRLLQMI